MTPYKRTEITVETDRVLIVRRRHSRRAWCRTCGRDVDMVGIADAALLTGMTESMVLENAAARKWHLSEARDRPPLVCLDSLLRSI